MSVCSLPPGPGLPPAAQAILWGLRYPEFTQRAHARFGPTFTVRAGSLPASVVTIDREAIRRLLTGDPLAKRHGNDLLRPVTRDGSLALLEPAAHLQRRKLLLPPFHGARIRTYAATMQELIDERLDQWRPGQLITVLPLAQSITLEVILRALLGVSDRALHDRLRQIIDDFMGYPLGAFRRRVRGRLDEAEVQPITRRIMELIDIAAQLPTGAVLVYFRRLGVRTPWNDWFTRRFWTLVDEFYELLERQIASTRNDPRLAERDDILATLVQATDDRGKPLDDADLRDDLFTLVVAGHDSTAAAIAWGLELLSHDRRVRERAAEAAHEGDDRYLTALVKEILRIRPPIPVVAGRVLSEPFTIGAHTIPPKVNIWVNGYGLHHDASIYPRPGKLEPERFLTGGPDRYSWLPFGGGAHRCLGAALAELEIKIALGSVLRRADLLPAGRRLAPTIRRGNMLIPRGGGRVVVAPRSSGWRPRRGRYRGAVGSPA